MSAGAAALMKAQEVSGGNPEPKGQLNQFCQRYCKRPITKEDVVYTAQQFGDVHQVTLTLNCIEGQQFVGETAATPKEAEKNAAMQALIHFQPMMDSLPPPASKNKKRKTTEGGEPAAKAAKTGEADPAAGMTDKVVLNTLCMKLLKTPMTKKEIVYETTQTPLGYQSTVKLPCMPGEWGQLAWAGEVATGQKEAEINAAKQAVQALNEGMETIKALIPQGKKPAQNKAQQAQVGKGGKNAGGGGNVWDMWQTMKGMMGQMGMDANMMKGMEAMMGKGMGKSGGWGSTGGGKGGGKDNSGGGQKKGPLPRKRISTDVVTGEVVEWKGNYGWAKPHSEISHPAANKRGGKIFIGKKDVVGGADLAVGGMVSFQVYEDSTGLGAEEVTTF